MNHGKCEKCWWWKDGWCYMYDGKAKKDSYCPDYHNRKYSPKSSGTLDEWINKNKDKL